MAKLKTLPELRDVATDQQNQAAQANLVIDRDTASRLGVTASAIDNTLYDAFGQRLVSIMFTQLNQYHVVLEVVRSRRLRYLRADGRRFRSTGIASVRSTRQCWQRQQVPLSAIAHFETTYRPADHQSPGTIPGGHHLFQPRR